MKRREMINDVQYLKEQGVTHIMLRKSSEKYLLKRKIIKTFD